MKNKNLKKIVLPSFALATLFSLNHNTVQAADNSEVEIVPEKVKTIELEDGTTAKVLSFASEEEANKYQEENGFIQSPNNEDENPIPMKATAMKASALEPDYSLVKYQGTLDYKMEVQYSYNATSKKVPWTAKVERSDSSTTSISVGAEFKSVFKAEVGKNYSNSTVWSQSYKLSIPAKKQLELWTWNRAQSWIFSSKPVFGKAAKFAVYRPTTSYGHEIHEYPKKRTPL